MSWGDNIMVSGVNTSPNTNPNLATATGITSVTLDELIPKPVKMQVILHPKEEGDDPPIIDIEAPPGSFVRVNFITGTVTLQTPDGSKPRMFDRDTGEEIE
jgi:hypothetical protein